jgi:hypothetical protein
LPQKTKIAAKAQHRHEVDKCFAGGIDTRENLMPHSREVPHTLMCSEVWGGNRKIFRAVQLSGVTAWVASLPLNEGDGGGDLHYMSVCDHDLISRVALVWFHWAMLT